MLICYLFGYLLMCRAMKISTSESANDAKAQASDGMLSFVNEK